jgi:cytochrome c-type biogenesis protein CcmH/NrfG
LSLGVAFVGFIFLFFIVFCLYFAWGGFFSSNDQKNAIGGGAVEDTPEWRAFLNRRQEIETDPTLDTASKQVLIDNWLTMASESKPHMGSASASTARLPWAKPATMPWWIAASLGFAVLFTYLTGAIHPGAFKWPQANSSNVLAPSVDQAVTASAGHPGDGVSLEERLSGLQARLAEQPDDLRGWVLLARTHASMSNYLESANALKKALELTPGHPDILADLADMTAMAQGRQLAGEPETYIAAALQSDPRHEKALALAASAAEQAGDQDKAQVYWQLLSQVQQANLKNSGSSQAAAPAPTPADDSADILASVNVNIPASALKQLGQTSALFVFLKAQAGPGMPLAVVRVPASQLSAGVQVVRIRPGDFIQEGALGNLPNPVHLQARLSIQGVAQTGAGDIESSWQTLSSNQLASGINLSLPEVSAK